MYLQPHVHCLLW